MNDKPGRPFSPRILAGLVLIGLGIVFTLDSFGVIDAGSIGDYWPLFLIVPGCVTFLWPSKPADRLWGLILIAVGGMFLMRNLGIFWFSFRHAWPAILIAIGCYLVWRAVDARGSGGPGGGVSGGGDGSRLEASVTYGTVPGTTTTRDLRSSAASAGDKLNEFAMFGGGDRMVRSPAFQGGTVAAIFGGFDIDMREAVMAGNAVTVEVFVMMGGIDLKVPEDWTVVIDVTPFMGGASYRKRGQATLEPEAPRKVLTVTGFVFMGGVEIKH